MLKALAGRQKELRQTLRDTRTLLMALLVPLFLLWLYGYALNFDIRHVALAVQDRDQQRRAAARSSRPSSTPRYFDLVARPSRATREIRDAARHATVRGPCW